MHSIRLPNKTHESRPWRIREIARDFTLEDVWALPVYGGTEDFQTLLENLVSFNPANAESLPARVLWRFRDRLGRWFGLGSISAPINSGRDRGARKLAIPGTNETSLTCRLPGDLRNTAADLAFDVLPFAPLYRTNVEFAAEVSNLTVHGVMHMAWVHQGEGRYQGQMAVYVKPRGPLGRGYMALIKPFRYWVVYPALMRQIERAWKARVPECGTGRTANSETLAAPREKLRSAHRRLQMTEQSTLSKAELLDSLRSSGENAVARLRKIPDAEFEKGRYESGWNGRQILAHIASIEWTYPRLLDVARKALVPKPAETQKEKTTDPPQRAARGGIDDYNARQVEKRAQMSVTELIAEFEANRATTVAAIEAADEALFSTTIRAAGGNNTGPLADVLHAVAVLHVAGHVNDIAGPAS